MGGNVVGEINLECIVLLVSLYSVRFEVLIMVTMKSLSSEM
jgi:hypothetical protein